MRISPPVRKNVSIDNYHRWFALPFGSDSHHHIRFAPPIGGDDVLLITADSPYELAVKTFL
jgi:hypothetical protein